MEQVYEMERHGKVRYLNWVKDEALRYREQLCGLQSVRSFQEHIPFEVDYIDNKMLPSLPPFEEAFEDKLFTAEKGVVFTCKAEESQLDMILRTVSAMEQMNKIKLPVEVWFSEEQKELEPVIRQHTLCRLGHVQCKSFYDSEVLEHLSRSELHPSGYAFCIYAIVFSRFSEVLFLDVDAVPLADVSHMFFSQQYVDSGQVFYADFWGTNSTDVGETVRVGNPLWEFVNVETYPSREMESSVVLLNKRKAWKEMNLVLHLARFQQLMEKHAPRGYPKVAHGDKDLWRLAYLYFGSKMYIGQPVALGKINFAGLFVRYSFGQIDTDRPNVVLFVHQPKVMELPRWPELQVGLLDIHCKDKKKRFYTWGWYNYIPCLFKYDYQTGQLEPGVSSAWMLHSCEQGKGRRKQCSRKQVLP